MIGPTLDERQLLFHLATTGSMALWGSSVSEAMQQYAETGTAPDRFYVHKFGRNSAIASGDTIMEPGKAFPYLTYAGTALAMRVKSGGNGADTAAGTGARTVTIQGLDANFAFASETVTLAGANASSATTTTFSRVLRVFVATTGTGRVNAGPVVIEDAGGVADYALIETGRGQGTIGIVTVPAGYRGYLTKIQLSSDVDKASATVAVDGYIRANAHLTVEPFSAKRLLYEEPSLSRDNGITVADFRPPIKLDPYTDLWFEGTPSSGTPIVDIEFTVLFEKIT